MKTLTIALLATSIATLSTAAFAGDNNNDAASRDWFLSQLSGQPTSQQVVVEGRQAARVNPAPSANDQLLIDLANARNASSH